MCDAGLLDLLVGILAVEAGLVPNTMAGFWEPVPNAALPCPILKGEVLSPTST